MGGSCTRLGGTPPLLPGGGRSLTKAAPLYAAGTGALLATAVARGMVDGRIWHPGCGFRAVTGVPCPGCGGTHALAALGSGDFTAAWLSHPLLTVVALALVGAAGAAWLDALLNAGRGMARLQMVSLHRRWIAGPVAAAVVTNWIYLWGSTAS